MARPPKWRNIEHHTVEVTGYLVVPVDSTYRRYATAAGKVPFKTEAEARRTLRLLERTGKIKVGSYRVAKAHVSEKRRVDIMEEPLKLVVNNG